MMKWYHNNAIGNEAIGEDPSADPGDGPRRMGGFYIIRFEVPVDSGHIKGAGALSLRRGVLTGIDSAGIRYDGTYEDEGGHLRALVILSVPTGARLTNGEVATKPMQIAMPLDLPPGFADGKPRMLALQGQPIPVCFEQLVELN